MQPQGIPVRVVRASAVPELSLTSLESEDQKPRGKALLKDPVLHPLLDRLRHADARSHAVLIQRALEALRTAAERSGGHTCEERLEDLRLVGRLVADIRPMSSALSAAVAQVLHAIEVEIARDPTVAHLLEALDQAVGEVEERYHADVSQVADQIARIIPPGGTVMTLGYCVPLLEGLQRCTQFSVRALVLDHQPTGDGRAMARALTALGKNTTLVSDCAMGLHVHEADLVVVGAESILPEGAAICAIGAYPLALVAAAAGIHFYVAAPSSALDTRPEHQREVVLEEGDPAEVWEESLEGLTVRNVLHERVPSDAIYGFITEDGYLQPASVQHEVVNREHLFDVLWER